MMALRVLYVIDSMFGGGAETSLAETIPLLGERGFDTRVVTLLDVAENHLTARLRDAGVQVSRARARMIPGWVAKLRAEIRRTRPDIIHTSLFRADVCGRVAALGSGIPVVTSLVNSYYGREHRRESRYGPAGVLAAQALDIATARRATVFHAISRHVAEVMARRLLLDRRRIMIVYRGRDERLLGRRTDARRAAVRRALGVDPTAPLVLVASRLDHQKGVDTALRAFLQVRRRLPGAQLIVAGGDDNGAEEIRRQAALVPGVRLLGHRTDIADLMCAADCLAFPSRWEGLGGVLIEALALELPIVASDIEPIREVLDGLDWPRAAVDDDRALAAGLLSVLERDLDLERIAAAGRERFESCFGLQASADGMARVYARALEAAPR